jgi:hypothetical protein
MGGSNPSGHHLVHVETTPRCDKSQEPRHYDLEELLALRVVACPGDDPIRVLQIDRHTEAARRVDRDPGLPREKKMRSAAQPKPESPPLYARMQCAAFGPEWHLESTPLRQTARRSEERSILAVVVAYSLLLIAGIGNTRQSIDNGREPIQADRKGVSNASARRSAGAGAADSFSSALIGAGRYRLNWQPQRGA